MKQYVARLKTRALGIFGNRCASCFCTTDLQFAHRKKNGFCGNGRGSKERIKNILTHLDNYILLCINCHREFDKKYNGELKL